MKESGNTASGMGTVQTSLRMETNMWVSTTMGLQVGLASISGPTGTPMPDNSNRGSSMAKANGRRSMRLGGSITGTRGST